ncbi:hypothetical protein [Streptomyces sp. NPDC001492]
MNDGEFNELVQRAQEADDTDDVWTAALLYERVHEAASTQGRPDWSCWALRRAAECWAVTSEPDRGLRLLLHALHDARLPGRERYWLHRAFLMSALHLTVSVDDLDGSLNQLSELAVDVWGQEGADPPYIRGELLRVRGDWIAALGAFEQAWAERGSRGPQPGETSVAESAVRTALYLGRRGEAQRWLELGTLHASVTWERCTVAAKQIMLAVFDNDAPTARAASRALDALVSPQRPIYRADAANWAVYALLLEEGQGDPAQPMHLARLRLKQQADDTLQSCLDRYQRHRVRVCLENAGLRYAAGMPPRDDAYYQLPDPPPDPDRIRLPDEIDKRLAVLHEACDAALGYARETDTRLGCTWRQQEIADLRDRGERIAQALRHRDRSH